MKSKTYVYIDGQNLYLGTLNSQYKWRVDLHKFYKYLRQKFKATEIFYYIGVRTEKNEKLYEYIENVGFKLQFRAHIPSQKSSKKGNVDVDILFDVMQKFYNEPVAKFLLVTQDGDYVRLVGLLKDYNRLLKIIFPNAKRASKLYKWLPTKYWMDLSHPTLIEKLKINKKSSGITPGARATVSPLRDPRLRDC